ncbi:MAG TPA: lipopolysaccharide heptosyltransferase II [Gemmatimonadales bacterium]|nr:lipopolysaccharide heptosyltransferase II [Gemmatimonadales bacterium]
MTSLVVQTAFLGDVVLTTPLLEALAARHGPVDVVTTPAAAPLVETHPAVRRVIAYDKRGKDRGLSGLARLVRKLRAERYEAAYLPHRSLRSAALAWLARIPTRVGFGDGWPLLYTEVQQRPRNSHEIDRLLALAPERAPTVAPRRPTLVASGADRAATDAFLGKHAIEAPFVALAPGSIWGSKRWPYYEELAQRLAERAAIVTVGGSEDAPLGEAIVKAVREGGESGGRKVANACGALTLRQAADVIGRAALLVTNDSAPLHFAQAGGTPTVAIFGPTVPAFGFGPRGPRDRVVELDGLLCRPCSAHGPPSCPLVHHRCMRALTVDAVLHAIDETGALPR